MRRARQLRRGFPRVIAPRRPPFRLCYFALALAPPRPNTEAARRAVDAPIPLAPPVTNKFIVGFIVNQPLCALPRLITIY